MNLTFHVREVYRLGRHWFIFRATLRAADDWNLFNRFLNQMEDIGAREVPALCVAADAGFWDALVQGQQSHGATGGEE